MALVPRVASIGTLLLATAALALFIYYRLNPPEGLRVSFKRANRWGQDAIVRVTGFYGLLSTAGSVTLGTLAVAYGLVLPGFIPLT